MNIKEAYSILEIPQTSTPEEAKKKYRELTKKYHPDINKESGAEDKFKKINEAYQVVSSGKSTDREEMHWQPTNRSNPFNPFGNQTIHQADNINLNASISFKESILGCKKDIKFNRQTKCKDCNGHGETSLNNGCVKCGGRGQVTGQQGHMIFIQTCDKCFGKSESKPCTTCNSKGILDAETSINVTIPGGIQNGNVLRIGGMGHFVTSFGPLDQNTDVHLCVHVSAEDGLKLDGQDIVCNLQISLLEALKGCNKKVKTILGETDIVIKSQSKNKDEVIIPHVGVNRIGNQRVILNVDYPEKINDLINYLDNGNI
jgi:molecular chaperone DnaJ